MRSSPNTHNCLPKPKKEDQLRWSPSTHFEISVKKRSNQLSEVLNWALLGGGSGLRPSHLVELIRSPSLSGHAGFLADLTRVVNILVAGRAPAALAPWIAGKPLTYLAKKDMTPRPIAVSETLRRLAGSCLMKRATVKGASCLQPLQVGIATRCGTDKVVHSVRRVVQKFGHNSDYGMLTVYFENAFNLCSRSAFLDATRNLIPELLPWVAYCYAHEPAYLWVGAHTIRSVRGTQQGDNLGGLLFDLVLHPIVLKIHQLLVSGDEEDGNMGNLLLQLWYHDDGYIIGRHDHLLKALDILSSLDATTRGLHLSLSKCKVWWPTAPPEAVQSLYPMELRQEYSAGTTVLNAPVCSAQFSTQFFSSHVHSLEAFLNAVVGIENTKVAFQFLRNCFGVCKIGYLLRVVPPSCTSHGAAIFDGMMERGVRTLAGGVLDSEISRELQLPVKSKEEKNPSLGLGFTSAKDIAGVAFLASSSASNRLREKVLSASIRSLTTYEDALEARRLWSQSCLQSRILPLSAFCSSKTPPQKTLTEAVHEAVQDGIPLGDGRRQSFRASMALPGAKEWAYCSPCAGLKTSIDAREFST